MDPRLKTPPGHFAANTGCSASLLYERHFTRLYGYFRVALRDPHEAEDAAQEVFARALAALPSFKATGAPIASWLDRIARNQALDYLKKMRPVSVAEPLELSAANRSTVWASQPPVIAEIDDEELLDAIRELPEAQRVVIGLRFILDMSFTEIAARLDRTEGGVHQLQHRALRSLRAALAARAAGEPAAGPPHLS
ncbi:MAG: hypothetical protein QOJ38_1576 [Solirubrobacterales bacterium]|jgi:RNA polymerase sigma-70 factor (ECF subfamily)|nr:hypothetical protein [Solirubrobacterales bacterium]